MGIGILITILCVVLALEAIVGLMAWRLVSGKMVLVIVVLQGIPVL